MVRFLFVLVVLYLCLVTANAQFFQFSQYNFTPQKVNPGTIALDNYAEVSTIYRTQQNLVDVSTNSYLLNARYPLFSGKKHWSSIGLQLGQDKAGLGGILQTDDIGLTWSALLEPAKYQRISFGLQTLFNSKSINTENLNTGSQFVRGEGFVEQLPIGEDLGEFNRQYLAFNAGISWRKTTKRKGKIAQLGLAAYNLNEPNESLLDNNSRLPMSIVLEGSYRIFSNNDVSVYSEILYTNTKGSSSLNAGTSTVFKLDKFDRRLWNQSVTLLTMYIMNVGMLIGLQWENENYALGGSYDLAINDRESHQGAFEIGLALRKPLRGKNRRKRRRPNRRTIPPRSREPLIEKPSSPSNQDGLVIHIPEEENIPLQSDSIELNIPPKKIITLRYDFDFGSSTPILLDDQIADEIMETIDLNQNVQIEIIGHTDNVGSLDYNFKLSIQRARAIYELLIGLGINESRMHFSGRGETEPLNDNSSSELRRKNRRVEIRFYY